MKSRKRYLNQSISIACIVFLILLSALLSIANLTLHRRYVYSDYRDYISYILNLVSDQIDVEDLRQCIDTKEESDKYRQTLLFMDNVIEHFEDVHYLYAIRPLNTDETGNTMSVFSAERYYDRYVDTEGNLYLGWISDDEFDSKTAAQMMDIMNGNGIVFFTEETEWGTDYTGAMPIRDSQGNGIAVLAVDIDISFIRGVILKYAMVNFVIIALFGAVFIVFFIVWSRKNITKPIRKLEESAVGFIGHSHGQRDVEALNFEAPVLKSENEIKSLSDAVVQMTEDMREYVNDIISAEKKAASMEEIANHDSLTGVRNKTAYNSMILQIADDKKVGLAVVDLNYLKRINDNHGHDKGDLAIKNLCSHICNVFSHSPVFRIGGDEFVIILRGNDYDNFKNLASQFNAIMEKNIAYSSTEPWQNVSAAMGAAFREEGEDMDSLFKRADSAMYSRKKEMKDKE